MGLPALRRRPPVPRGSTCGPHDVSRGMWTHQEQAVLFRHWPEGLKLHMPKQIRSSPSVGLLALGAGDSASTFPESASGESNIDMYVVSLPTRTCANSCVLALFRFASLEHPMMKHARSKTSCPCLPHDFRVAVKANAIFFVFLARARLGRDLTREHPAGGTCARGGSGQGARASRRRDDLVEPQPLDKHTVAKYVLGFEGVRAGVRAYEYVLDGLRRIRIESLPSLYSVWHVRRFRASIAGGR